MEDFSTLFTNLTFPAAVAAVLIFYGVKIVKRLQNMVENTVKANEEMKNEYVEHLKTANVKLVSVVEENTKTIQKFSLLLEQLSTYLSRK
jgi:uncharacterized membrane protein YhiD involved in acid resistance